MAAPVGHIICALALLNSSPSTIADKNAFLLGTNFPDIGYMTDEIERATTHKMMGHDLGYVLDTPSSFEAGRRFHVFVDQEREKHMREHRALRFIEDGPFRTQLLKLVEDHIMFDKLKNKFHSQMVFSKIHDDERRYHLDNASIESWHKLLSIYLDQSYWFNVTRYFQTFREFKKSSGFSNNYFDNLWFSLKTLGFFIYVYFQLEKLSRNKELRTIILDFYENKINYIIKSQVRRTRAFASEKKTLATVFLNL